MSPLRQRLAIAEALGWKDIQELGYEWWRAKCGAPIGWCGRKDGSRLNEIPDYPNDLNAMHEAEKSLDVNQRLVFGSRLYEVTGAWNKETGRCDGWKEIHSTAAQRAEAFLKTIGKLEEISAYP